MVKTYQTLLCESAEVLSEHSDSARLDAEILLAHLLGKGRVWLATHVREEASEEICRKMRELTARRAKHEPVAYLVGEREFMGLPFSVRPGVLIPRPDTETLVNAVLEERKAEEPYLIDLCTGSGAIAVSLAHFLPKADVLAVDVSDICVQTAKENAKRNGVSERVSVLQADILSEDFPRQICRKADILVSNPPYIRKAELAGLMPDVRDFEPASALDGGEDGLFFYRKIAELLPHILRRDGLIVLEAGYNQAGEIALLLRQQGCRRIWFRYDLSGICRVVIAYF